MRDLRRTGQPIKQGLGQWPEICAPSLQPYREMLVYTQTNLVNKMVTVCVCFCEKHNKNFCDKFEPGTCADFQCFFRAWGNMSCTLNTEQLNQKSSWCSFKSTPKTTLGNFLAPSSAVHIYNPGRCRPPAEQGRRESVQGSCCSPLLLPQNHLSFAPSQCAAPSLLPFPLQVCSASFRCKLGLAQQPFKYGYHWNRPLSQVCFHPHQTKMMAFLVAAQQRVTPAMFYSY